MSFNHENQQQDERGSLSLGSRESMKNRYEGSTEERV